jgi:hypothetical protein
MLYHKGQYEAAFTLIEKMVREETPGDDVHRCIALMQRAFAKLHKLDDPVIRLTPSAQAYIDTVEANSDKTAADLVILAAIKELRVDHERVGAVPAELEKLARDDASDTTTWCDWARWEVIRLWCSSLYTAKDALGVAMCKVDEKDRRVVLATAPISTIRARHATIFLRAHPDTYMGRQLRTELLNWRLAEAERSLSELAANEWMTTTQRPDEIVPFNDQVIARLQRIKESYGGIRELIPKDYVALINAEIRLDSSLWGDGNERVIVPYVRVVAKQRPIPSDVEEWLEQHKDTDEKR